MMRTPILSIENLVVKRAGVTVVDIERLDVAEGRTLALIGPNGAGKSSLLLAMAGLLPVTAGKLVYDSHIISDRASLAMLRQHAAVVFQEPLLLNDTVYKNVALGLKFRHLDAADISRAVDEALSYFGITHLAKRSARALSGGEAKRVSLARAFAFKPRIILLDEAFSSLDPPTRESLIEDLQEILKETKITAIMAQHDREETLRLAHDVAVISQGKLIQTGATARIFNQPANEFVAGFVGAEAVLEGVVQGAKDGMMEVRIGECTVMASGDDAPGTPVYCCLRPEHITVSKDEFGKTSARNVFKATVRKIVRQAYFYKLILDAGFPLSAFITLPSYEDLQIHEGQWLTVTFKATAVHVIRRTQFKSETLIPLTPNASQD